MATEGGFGGLGVVERCLRCGGELEWRHQTWQCGLCRFKVGCCEGDPQSCDEAAVPRNRGEPMR